jgi:hypothetical protein
VKIRPEQMAALGAAREADLIEESAEHVRVAYPDLAFGRAPAQVEPLVRGIFEEAKGLGLTGARAVLRYVDYRAEIGEGLVSSPAFGWAREILADASLDDDARIARLDRLAYGGPLLPEDEA